MLKTDGVFKFEIDDNDPAPQPHWERAYLGRAAFKSKGKDVKLLIGSREIKVSL